MSDVAVEVTNGERIDVGDGVTIPKAWDVVAAGEANVAGAIHLHVQFDEKLRRTVAASVAVDRPGEGAEVTAAALRDVRVQYLVALSSMRVVEVRRPNGGGKALHEYFEELRSRTDRTSEETVREAVVLYRVAATVNLAPLKLVSEQLGVSVSTATRMMARAREAGLADDLITRDMRNRAQGGEQDRARPHQVPGSPSGPSIDI